jgi:hypothetical protein
MSKRIWDGLNNPEEKDYWLQTLTKRNIGFDINGVPYKIIP